MRVRDSSSFMDEQSSSDEGYIRSELVGSRTAL